MYAFGGSLTTWRLRSPLVALASAALLVIGSLSLAAAQDAAEEGVVSPPGDWVRATLPFTDAGLEIFDVTAGGPGFVAVGGGHSPGSQWASALIWVSDTGRRWQSVPLFGDAARGAARAVTITPDGFVAVGSDCCNTEGTSDRGAVWLSREGIIWERLPEEPTFASAALFGVASSPDGIVAIGCQAFMECGSGLAWTSPDGRTWSDPITMSFLPMDVAWTSLGWLALGASEPYDGFATVATSADGTTWSEPVILDVKGSLMAAVDTPDGVLAVGSVFDPDEHATRGLLVRSSDGLTWERLTGRRPGATWFEDVASRGDGFLLVGSRPVSDDMVPSILWSSDLAGYSAASFAREVKPTGMLHAAAFGADGAPAVAVGSSTLNRGQVPAIWVARD